MGIADRLKGLTGKAKDAAAGHEDQIHEAVRKAEAAADERTGGRYHDKIAEAADKADAFAANLKPADPQPRPTGAERSEPTPPAAR